MLTHIVMWRFHDQADVDEAVSKLRGMVGKVAGANSIKVGRNRNESANAFELVLISEHDSPDALTTYAADPVHQDIVSWMSDRVATRAVVDTDSLG